MNRTVFSLADKITKTAKSLKESDVTVEYSEELGAKLGGTMNFM
jgi:hypothetical protein